MKEIFLFIFLCYGISNILIYGSIFEWWRNFTKNLGKGDYSLYKLFTCMMCLPTWVGILISFIFIYIGQPNLSPFYSIGIKSYPLNIFLDGCFASGCVWIIHTIQEWLESNQ